MNNNWPKWIYASILKHFASTSGFTTDPTSSDLYVILEGEENPLKDEFIEIRIDGPDFRQSTKNEWFANVEVNVLIQAKKTNDFYKMQKLAGKVVTAFSDIILSKVGDGDGSLGCMKLADQPISVTHFGQVDPDVPLLQSSVEANYETWLGAN